MTRKMYYPSAQTAGNSTYRYINTFKPLPWQRDPWLDTSSILLLTGSAGGGKSSLAAEKIHGFALKYPGSMCLVVRKTRDSMNNSTVLLLERRIIGKDPRVIHVRSRNRFEYENGSILAYEGMSDEAARERIRSMGQEGGLDMVWMEEAHEFEEEDFNELLARMRGKSAPWRQIILSTNPDAPGHWINLRLILGEEASVYYSKATDNPHNPDSYIESLNKLTGIQRERLVLGKWVLGSGIIFDTWDDSYNAKTGDDHNGNVTLDADYVPGGGPVIWSVDDGYAGEYDKKTHMYTGRSHPRVFLLAQKRATGQIAVFAEHYAIETMAMEHIETVKEYSKYNGWPLPSYVVRDRAAVSLDGAFSKTGFSRVRYNAQLVEESIKELREWITADRNGFRRFIVHPRCKNFRFEMVQYSMDKSGRVIKEYDNGPDAARYLVFNETYGKDPTVDVVSWSMVANGRPN